MAANQNGGYSKEIMVGIRLFSDIQTRLKCSHVAEPAKSRTFRGLVPEQHVTLAAHDTARTNSVAGLKRKTVCQSSTALFDRKGHRC